MPIAMSPGSAMSWSSPAGRVLSTLPHGGLTRGALRSSRTHIRFREGSRLAEFLAIHQTDASLLGCLLRRLAGKVSLGAPERGTGVGFFQSDDVLLRKRPGSGAPAAEKLAEGVESEA